MRLVLRLTFLLSFLFAAAGPASAQEIDARININYKKIQGSSTSVFETLKTALTEFINERQWTTLQFKRNERINCNFNITVNAYDEAANSFECALMVQSNRPVFNSNYTTTVFSTNDPNFNFNYQEYDQIEFRPDILDNNLTAVIAYYVYLMIGMDLDTMSPLGGTELLKMAQNIVNNAQSLNYKAGKPSRILKTVTPLLPTCSMEVWSLSGACNTNTIARDWTLWQRTPNAGAPASLPPWSCSKRHARISR